MNEMLAFPFMVGVIIGTALLSSIVTSALPYLPKYWHAFKMRIRRVFTPKMKSYPHYVELLRKRDNDLQEQIDNLANKIATRDKHRAGNIRRVVREYLEELKNG